LIVGLPLGSRHPPTLAIGREKCLRKKAIEMQFLSFNREQALAKLTWWLIDSNVIGLWRGWRIDDGIGVGLTCCDLLCS
jgi:hypothetical protein